MKIVTYKVLVLFSLLLTLVACAEEGPYRLGKLEYDIKASIVTPTSAIVTVDFPITPDNLIELDYLSAELLDRPINNDKPDWKERIHYSFLNKDDTGAEFFFDGLSPNTMYYLVLYTHVDLNKGGESLSKDIYSGFNFKTAKEGDYSALGEARCELLSKTSDVTRVKFQLPEGLIFATGQSGDEVRDLFAVRAYASTSPDMSNAVESMAKTTFAACPADVFDFRGLDNTEYYFQLKGDFYSSHATEFRDFDYKNITLDVSNPLDLKITDDK